MIGPLQQSLKDLGMAAVAQAAQMAKLIAQQVDLHAFKAEILAQLDQLSRSSITYTTRLIVACSGGTDAPAGTRETARELEEKLIARLGGTAEESSDFQQAVERLVRAAAAYANRMAELVDHCVKAETAPSAVSADSHEQTYNLACAAVAFTLQLSILSSVDPDIARVQAREMELWLISKLDAAFAPQKDVS